MAIIHSLKYIVPFLFVVPLVATCCHSLSFVVTHHSLSFVVPLVVIRCHSLPFVVPLVVTRCHALSLDLQLVRLFINDLPKHEKNHELIRHFY